MQHGGVCRELERFDRHEARDLEKGCAVSKTSVLENAQFATSGLSDYFPGLRSSVEISDCLERRLPYALPFIDLKDTSLITRYGIVVVKFVSS